MFRQRKINWVVIGMMVVFLFAFQGPLLSQEEEESDIDEKTKALFKMSLEELMNVKVITDKKTTKWSYAKTCSMILLKIISMDKNIDRLENPIKIGVTAKKIYEQLSALQGKMKINGRHFFVKRINSFKSAEGYKIIYICKNSSINRRPVIKKLARNGCFVFCEDEQNILFGEAAVLVKIIDRKPKVVINLDNVENQGADFPEEELYNLIIIRKGD